MTVKDHADRKKVSVIVITKNEARNLPFLLPNLQFADELIIVDSYSNDETEQIINKYPKVKFLQRAFTSYSEQRNFAIDQATHDWIFFIDADERIPKSLQFEILQALTSKKNIMAYGVYRQFYFDKKPLKYGGFQTDKVIRLFNRHKARYNTQKLVHETLNVDGTTSSLQSKLLHFSFENKETYKQKLITYAKLRAQELNEKGVQPNLFHLYMKPLYRFFYHYIIRRGFLDGKEGYTMAQLNAFGVKQRFVALQELQTSQW